MWEVNLREDEWNKLQKGLSDYHENQIGNIKDVIEDIENLLKDDKYFNVEQTKQNLLALLNVLKTNVLPLVENTFQNTEQYVQTLIISFNNIDTLC